ncbi:uncharacterized protein Bfra_012388 [Botrytis fragariae]|uniref:F-box domain-containing protein n=1 Tax=Botrytis fragariae TaxID=1964551 RepID=A0A8H6AIW7_9HELO|nr:uncharacterized protein Bfra_012388 [Botrytis fragariae]KAF5868477.1 hypothetical protein Bfra_012388 [Botrytis fragariae]
MPITLDDLPEEIIIGIGLCLSKVSLVMLAQCSSYFYAVCIELLYYHCAVENRIILKILINTILNKPVIGRSIRWLDLRHFNWNDLCHPAPWKTTSLDLFKKATLVQKNLVSWNISTWTGAFWMDISCWALITVLLCLVPELRVLGLPTLGEERRWHGVLLRGSHCEVSAFSDFIARLVKDQRTESPEGGSLRVLTNLESITIAPDFCNRRTALDSIMPLMFLRSVKRFKAVSVWHHSWMNSRRLKGVTPIPNIESLNFVSCDFSDDIVTFLRRFTGIQRFYLGGSPNIMDEFDDIPLCVESILEGLTSSKDSLKYVDVSFVSRRPGDDSLSLSQFKRLQVVKLWPSPSIWSSESPIEDESRLINSLPPGLRILVCKPFYDQHDVVSLKQLYELVANKETYAPELRQIELIWDDAGLTYKCEDCENHCELSEKIPFFTKLIEECKTKNICIFPGHPSWKATGTAEPEDLENTQGLFGGLL